MANIWTEFNKLIPRDRLVVATVDTVNEDGTSNLTTVDGMQVIARGTGVAAGNKAFIRGGVIEGEAPNLPIYTLDI